MPGVIFFLLFIVIGVIITNKLFQSEQLFTRIWIGMVFGILGLMWGVVPFSFIFGFNILSNLLALAVMITFCACLLMFYKKKQQDKPIENTFDIMLFSVVIPITLLICYLLNTHILSPGQDGGLYSGQSTYGDLSLHLGIITSIGEQGFFPPDYSIFPGSLLSYPFLADSLSSSLYIFGTPLRWAVLIPSYITALVLVSGFYILSLELLKKKIGAVISTILFFFNGGFGFIYFMDGIRNDPTNFTRMFKEYYNTPTNYNEHFIRWSNTICDMIIPQRTLMMGWAIVFCVFWLLIKAINGNDRYKFLYAGIIAGLMPMIHTHSFLALGIVSTIWCIVFYFQSDNKKEYIYNWSLFIVPALIISIPQLLFWTFPQATSGSFVKLHFNWANEGDTWIWFWIKNVGMVFILLLPALLSAEKKMISIYLGAVTLFFVAEFVIFQPNTYDNNKLFYIWYVFSVILVSSYICTLYDKLKGIRGRWSILAIIIFFCTFSGVLTIGREVVSRYEIFDPISLEAAEFIKDNTPKDALFLTSDQHLNVVSTLAGRNIVSGSPVYLNFHGLKYSERFNDVEKMFKDQTSFNELSLKYNIDYVYFSNWELSKFGIKPDFFINNFKIVFQKTSQSETIYIFAISQRANKNEVNPDE